MGNIGNSHVKVKLSAFHQRSRFRYRYAEIYGSILDNISSMVCRMGEIANVACVFVDLIFNTVSMLILIDFQILKHLEENGLALYINFTCTNVFTL